MEKSIPFCTILVIDITHLNHELQENIAKDQVSFLCCNSFLLRVIWWLKNYESGKHAIHCID